MPDAHELTVCIPETFDECPTWWQHMVSHLINQHTPWHMQDTHAIIRTYLQRMYQAEYPLPENSWQPNKVTFPHTESYCECVLQWS